MRCGDKISYPDEGLVMKAKKQIVRRLGRKWCDHYFCLFCGGWHLGRKSPDKKTTA